MWSLKPTEGSIWCTDGIDKVIFEKAFKNILEWNVHEYQPWNSGVDARVYTAIYDDQIYL